ncbi:juvenile hormone inducible-like protein [Nasonia vitripennis]|uniref:CHK kinase-like domain-containing protein n=1 Tax=Nasonia vitripennis TaxID=7425 RepID=A0A7M6UDC8_NASVI|nr:juvenile hormone inducible-like protein [Nasonia vitripennis]
MATCNNNQYLDREEVAIMIKEAFGTATKLVKYYSTNLSDKRVGFMSSHRTLVVVVEENDCEQKTYSFFLKSIPYEIENQLSWILESKIFTKETNFFKFIVPELMASINDKSWIARCYFVKDDLMVFEDLKVKKFKISTKILDEPCVRAALSSYAKLHAASILAERRIGKSWIDLYPELLEEVLFVCKGMSYKWINTGVDINVAIAEKLGFDHKSVSAMFSQIFDKAAPSKKRQNVLCHGDPWSYNLMFDDSQPLPKCVLVDFQVVRYVPPMFEIAQFMHITTGREFRKQRETEMLKHYHDVLCKTLKENSDGQAPVPSFSDILDQYEEMKIVGIISAALYNPTILVNGDVMTEKLKSFDGFADLMFGSDRVKFMLEYMEKDTIFKDRLVECITELIERSNILQANK